MYRIGISFLALTGVALLLSVPVSLSAMFAQPPAHEDNGGSHFGTHEQQTLPLEELDQVLAMWDTALEAGDLRGLMEIMERISEEDKFLRYDNSEIKVRVIALYKGEMEARFKGASPPTADVDGSEESAQADDGRYREHDEVYLDYLDALVPLALSTFSPEICETVLTHRLGGVARYQYLATVDAEYVLELLLEAEPQERTHVNQPPNILELPAAGTGKSVRDAFRLLDVLCDIAPETVVAEEDRVLEFVRKYALKYSEPMEVSYRDDPRHLSGPDYLVRRLALQTLDLLAETADIRDLVEEIMRDAPEPPHGTGPNEIIRKGEELIERVESLD